MPASILQQDGGGLYDRDSGGRGLEEVMPREGDDKVSLVRTPVACLLIPEREIGGGEPPLTTSDWRVWTMLSTVSR
jgi:hypothetical protein